MSPNNPASLDTPEEDKKRLLIDFPWRARIVLLVLIVLFVALGATYFWAINTDNVPSWVAPVMTVMWLSSGFAVMLLLYWMWRQFSRFSNDLSVWANELLEGDFSSRMPIKTDKCLSKGIRQHINAIAKDYEDLSNLQQERLSRQADRIKQKKHYRSV